MSRLRVLIARLRRNRDPDDVGRPDRRDAVLDAREALTAGRAGDMGGEAAQASGGLPPSGWLKDYDEGRPRT